jgi:hypothetical protein
MAQQGPSANTFTTDGSTPCQSTLWSRKRASLAVAGTSGMRHKRSCKPRGRSHRQVEKQIKNRRLALAGTPTRYECRYRSIGMKFWVGSICSSFGQTRSPASPRFLSHISRQPGYFSASSIRSVGLLHISNDRVRKESLGSWSEARTQVYRLLISQTGLTRTRATEGILSWRMTTISQ